MAISPEKRAQAAALARKIVELTGGRFKANGKSKTFDQIEDEATEIGDLITSLAIQEMARENSEAEECQNCPMCDRPGEKTSADNAEAIVLQTARGEVECMADGYYCRRCRRSFFPSAC